MLMGTNDIKLCQTIIFFKKQWNYTFSSKICGFRDSLNISSTFHRFVCCHGVTSGRKMIILFFSFCFLGKYKQGAGLTEKKTSTKTNRSNSSSAFSNGEGFKTTSFVEENSHWAVFSLSIQTQTEQSDYFLFCCFVFFKTMAITMLTAVRRHTYWLRVQSRMDSEEAPVVQMFPFKNRQENKQTNKKENQ